MKILISSANTQTRERWKQILQNTYQILEASTIDETKKKIQQHSVDLILLHRSMVSLDFIAQSAPSRVFVLADIPNDDEAITIFRLGAIGYANTYISPARLKEAVHVALSGRVWVGQKLMQTIIRRTPTDTNLQQAPMSIAHHLSEREWEVAQLVSKGESNLEIAADLNIAERTVKAHISSIFKKTKTGSRLQLALHVKNLLASQ